MIGTNGQQSRDLRSVERMEVDAFDPIVALELGEERHHAIVVVWVVRTYGQDRQDTSGTEVTNQEREEVPRITVGPLDIFEDEHNWLGATDSFE